MIGPGRRQLGGPRQWTLCCSSATTHACSLTPGLPRDLLFAMRCANVARAVNRELGGSSAERFRLFGEAAVRGAELTRDLEQLQAPTGTHSTLLAEDPSEGSGRASGLAGEGGDDWEWQLERHSADKSWQELRRQRLRGLAR